MEQKMIAISDREIRAYTTNCFYKPKNLQIFIFS